MKGIVEVMCKEAEYDPRTGMVSWRLETPDGERVALYHVSDLVPTIGISGDPTHDDWHFFCKVIKGKKFKLQFE